MPNKAPQNINHFLDSMIETMQLKNDAALSRKLEVSAPVISKLRHHRLPLTALLLLRFYDHSGLSIEQLRAHLYYVAPAAA